MRAPRFCTASALALTARAGVAALLRGRARLRLGQEIGCGAMEFAGRPCRRCRAPARPCRYRSRERPPADRRGAPALPARRLCRGGGLSPCAGLGFGGHVRRNAAGRRRATPRAHRPPASPASASAAARRAGASAASVRGGTIAAGATSTTWRRARPRISGGVGLAAGVGGTDGVAVLGVLGGLGRNGLAVLDVRSAGVGGLVVLRRPWRRRRLWPRCPGRRRCRRPVLPSACRRRRRASADRRDRSFRALGPCLSRCVAAAGGARCPAIRRMGVAGSLASGAEWLRALGGGAGTAGSDGLRTRRWARADLTLRNGDGALSFAIDGPPLAKKLSCDDQWLSVAPDRAGGRPPPGNNCRVCRSARERPPPRRIALRRHGRPL